jgi:Ca2+-binding RTX toxin-like protein
MEEHADDDRFEATLFASPGYGGGQGEDSRVANLWLDGDKINLPAYFSYNSGDDNTIFHNLGGMFSADTDLHSMLLYQMFSTFLIDNGIDRSGLTNLGGRDYDRFYAFARTSGSTVLDIGEGNDVITGSEFPDVILGGGGSDTLHGGIGTIAPYLAVSGIDLKVDRLYGGKGNDTFVVNEAIDVVIEKAGEGEDTISSSGISINLANYSQVERVVLTGSRALNAIGNEVNNRLAGNAAANTLDGGLGNDRLSGLAGNDILIGWAGKDTLSGGADNDIFRFRTASHSPVGANADVITDFDDYGNDRIDLSLVFGPTMTYRHNLAFTAAGQVRINDITGADLLVEVNTGGSLAADMQIRLVATTLASMTASDFIL